MIMRAFELPGESSMDQVKMKERISELTELLSRASEAYYNENTEIMPNLEYDRLYDELSDLEKKTGR